MEYLVELKNVSHSFDVMLYRDISFGLKPMHSMAILGASGSGKSTILNHLSTLLPPQEGQINIANFHNVYDLDENKLLYLRQKIMGVIFQAHYLFRGFNVMQNIRIAELIAQTKMDMNILEEFGIAHTLKQQIGELSGGQQQRLSIARVLTKKPLVLLADEPTGNLDKDTAINIMKYLLSYVKNNKATLVLATHDTHIAEMCSHVVLLENGFLRYV